jgi:hypothetical protein
MKKLVWLIVIILLSTSAIAQEKAYIEALLKPSTRETIVGSYDDVWAAVVRASLFYDALNNRDKWVMDKDSGVVWFDTISNKTSLTYGRIYLNRKNPATVELRVDVRAIVAEPSGKSETVRADSEFIAKVKFELQDMKGIQK